MEKGLENNNYFKREEVDKMIKEERLSCREDLKYYLAFLELEKEDLENKKVLDVGSSTGRIVEEINKIGGKAFGLDPIYVDKKREEVLKNKDNLVAGMAGNGNDMPFKNETFDIIINNFSTFNYAKNEDIVSKNFEQQLELLREEGAIYVFPLKWSFKLNDYVPELEDNFIQDKEVVENSFVKKIEELKQREGLDISFDEPDYKKLSSKIQVPLHKPEKVYYLKIKKILVEK
jgi:SAM-dependent methyltransferase